MTLLFAGSAVVLLLFVFDAFVLTFGARLLKSPRRSLLRAIAALMLISAVSIGLLALLRLGPAKPFASPVAAIGAAVLQLAVDYLIIMRVFALPAGRALALFGIYFLANLMQLLLAVAVVKPFVAEAFEIPYISMSPTLNPGDRILVNKLERPRRWDLVVYHPRLPDGTVSNEIYCKRLVGLPGDKLRFQGGMLYVNDKLMQAPTVVSGRYNMKSIPTDYLPGQTIALAGDEIFVIGDNVPRSLDSRSVGPSKLSSVVGVADLMYWPMGRFRILR